MAEYLRSLTSAFWPISNLLVVAAGIEHKPESSYGKGKPYTVKIEDHLGIFAGVFPRLLLAIYILYTLPDLATASTLGPWALHIVLRDLAITTIVAGFWDTLLYSSYSPLRKTMHAVKFNPSYPKETQLPHDIFWALCSTVISSAFEVTILHLWATGTIRLAFPVEWWTHGATVAWLLTMPYWRLTHFFFVHRMMHKWNTKSIPDFGAFLYKHVHALHHKSRNPTSWSGISMHPVESSIYYTAMLIPVVFGAHPLVMLFTKFDLTIAALIGHDGFGYPSTGSHDHWLHHHLVTVNYGENYVPWDYWFGSYAGSEEDYVAKFGATAKSNFVFHPGDSLADVANEVKTVGNNGGEGPASSSKSSGGASRRSKKA